MKVTPHLNDSDEVRLDIIEVISDIQNQPAPGDTFGTISYLERTASTTLTVKDGSTVVIGGLTRNRVSRVESKVPVLGDIPVLGALFRTRSDRTEKSNLVLVLTPYIIRNEDDMRRIYEKKQQERQELIDREIVFEGTTYTPSHDWKRTRGLLAEIRGNHREVETKKKEAEDAMAKEETKPSLPPLELPVPQIVAAPKSAPPPPATSGGGGVAVRPSHANIVER